MNNATQTESNRERNARQLASHVSSKPPASALVK
jgi:hypothetical protein